MKTFTNLNRPFSGHSTGLSIWSVLQKSLFCNAVQMCLMDSNSIVTIDCVGKSDADSERALNMYLGLFPDRAVASRLPCCSKSLCQAANSIHLCLGSWKCGRADRESVDWLLKPGVCFRVKEVCVQKEALMSRHGRWSAWFCSTAFVWFSHLLFLWTVEWDMSAYGFVSVLFSAHSLTVLCENCEWIVCIHQTCTRDIKFVTRFLNYVLSL